MNILVINEYQNGEFIDGAYTDGACSIEEYDSEGILNIYHFKTLKQGNEFVALWNKNRTAARFAYATMYGCDLFFNGYESIG